MFVFAENYFCTSFSRFFVQSSLPEIINYQEILISDIFIQVYTVGEEYAHAEARKSPALDGKVERDAMGKEIRYPVILSASEKLIAKQVCSIFKVRSCGYLHINLECAFSLFYSSLIIMVR